MNAGPDVERLISGWLHEEASGRAPDRILEAAGRTIDRTHQRRVVAAWREPMSGLRGLAAAAAVGALVVAGAFLFTRPSLGPGDQPSPSPGGQPTASAAAVPSSTPDPSIMAAFRTARDRICTAAAAEGDPLKERFLGAFDGSITPAQRDDWIAALESFAAIQGDAIDEIAELTPPTEIAAANAENITIFRDMNARILSIASSLRARDDAAARETDTSTNHLNDLISDYEVRNGLVRCP